jgi:hypothetical protein
METLLANAPADPATLFGEEIDDLMLEARNYLDGDPIANEQQAEAVSSLLNRLRRVAKAVQAKWKPLIDKADLAANTAKQALAPWLCQVEEKQRHEAELARQEADRIAQVAAEAHAKASGNLEATEDAERLLKAAAGAQRFAAKAEKAKPLATGGERAIGLVDKFTPELTDACEALKHYRAKQPEALKAWLLDQAEKDVRSGCRTVPGFIIHHGRIAR